LVELTVGAVVSPPGVVGVELSLLHPAEAARSMARVKMARLL
jgi:hypothetical protein